MMAGPRGGLAVARGPAGNTCCVAQGEECTACGVGCGGAGAGNLAYVGMGQGDYVQETTYQYVGYGGDFTRRRDFTCIIVSGSCLGLLLLLPLLLWLFSGSTDLYDCTTREMWSDRKAEFCCVQVGVGCTTQPVTSPPTPPPTPPPTVTNPSIPIIPVRPTPAPAPTPPADPYNCAVGQYLVWAQPKKDWCCSNHHICGQPTEAPRPADPYNCADGFANWVVGWSVAKKEWCCRVHGKGCPGGGGCTSSEPYDCAAGFANWVAGWSAPKKVWCCANKGKGCQSHNGGCA